MKKKELKSLAQRIAKAEIIVQTSEDSKEINKARAAILELTSKVENMEDILALDELIQEILEQKS